jgi:hypothetical protein
LLLTGSRPSNVSLLSKVITALGRFSVTPLMKAFDASAANIAGFAQHLRNHNGAADDITSVAIDMKFHVVAHASALVNAKTHVGFIDLTRN